MVSKQSEIIILLMQEETEWMKRVSAGKIKA